MLEHGINIRLDQLSVAELDGLEMLWQVGDLSRGANAVCPLLKAQR